MALDPTKLAALSAAITQFSNDAANVVADENGITPLQAAVTTAQTALTTAQAAEAASEATLTSDYNAVVAAADAAGLPRPPLPVPAGGTVP